MPNKTNIVVNDKRLLRFSLLFVLAVTETMPVMFMMQALPVIMRRAGASLQQLSLLYVVMLPWSLKVLWAPMIDRFGWSRIGHYRSWLLALHPAMVLVIVAMALLDFEALLLAKPALGIALLMVLASVSATADVAAHGIAVNILAPAERGLGNASQVGGMLTGYMLGGGAMLMGVERIGWRTSLLALAAVAALPMIAVWFFHEHPSHTRALGYREAFGFFRRPGVRPWLVAMALLTGAQSVVTMPLHTALVDRGMDLAEIGFLTGILGGATGVAGSAIAGVSIQRFGRKATFYATTLGCAGVTFSLVGVPLAGTPAWAVKGSVALLMAVWMALATCQTTLMMDHARPHVAGSDYTVQHGLSRLASMAGGAVGSLAAARTGTLVWFAVAPLAVFAAAGLSTRVLRGTDTFSGGRDPVRSVSSVRGLSDAAEDV